MDTEKLRIALCDANGQEREGYAKVCDGICEQNNIRADFRHYSNSSDLLFDMGDDQFLASVNIVIVDPEHGFDTAPLVMRDNGYDGMILYLSNSDSPEYYRQAFDVNAFNYVKKGTDPQILSRFRAIFESAAQAAQKTDRQYLAVSYAGEHKRIEVKDILYFETADHMKVNVVYKGGSFEFLSTMQSLEERYGSRGFVRVHRSYLVSINTIHRMERDGLTLNNGHRIIVSRDRYPELKAAMLCWQS